MASIADLSYSTGVKDLNFSDLSVFEDESFRVVELFGYEDVFGF